MATADFETFASLHIAQNISSEPERFRVACIRSKRYERRCLAPNLLAYVLTFSICHEVSAIPPKCHMYTCAHYDDYMDSSHNARVPFQSIV